MNSPTTNNFLARLPALSRRLTPPVALAAAMVLAAAFLLYETRGQSLFADEWAFFAIYREWDLDALLNPNSGNLVLGPALVYKALFGIFGGGEYVAHRVLWVALDLLNAGLVFVLMRRRVGGWVALPAAALLLVLGGAQEVLGGPLGIGILFTIACGLGALLLLERRDRPGDVAACALLVVAVASYTAGVAFLIAAAVEVLLVRPGRLDWRRALRGAWVIAVPVALYGAWRIWALQFDDTSVTLDNVLSLPSSLAASAATVAAVITGTFRVPGSSGIAAGETFTTEIGWVLALAAAGLVALRVRARERWPIDPRVWVFAAALISYWLLIGANLGPTRSPEASRYQYPAAVLLFLLAAELGAGVKPNWKAGLAIAAVFFAGLLGNLSNLHEASKFLRVNSEENVAELAALELVRENAQGHLAVEPLAPQAVPTDDMVIPIDSYFAAAEGYGSPADSLDQMKASSNQAREHADAMLVHALALLPVAEPLSASAPATRVAGPLAPEAASGAGVTPAGRCLRVSPQLADAKASFLIPPGGFAIEPAPGGPPVTVSLRRFGDAFVATTPAAPPGVRSVVAIPPDADPTPWHAEITSSYPYEVCSA